MRLWGGLHTIGLTDFELVGMIGVNDGEDVEDESVSLPFIDDVVDIQSAVGRRHAGVATALDPTFQAPRHLTKGRTTTPGGQTTLRDRKTPRDWTTTPRDWTTTRQRNSLDCVRNFNPALRIPLS